MKLIIAGSRGVTKYQTVRLAFRRFRYRRAVTTIVSGKAPGVDTLGEEVADEYGLEIMAKPADWLTYGKRAGYIRNGEMAEVADALLAIWDGKSPGTKQMIKLALAKGLYVEVYSDRGDRLFSGYGTAA